MAGSFQTNRSRNQRISSSSLRMDAARNAWSARAHTHQANVGKLKEHVSAPGLSLAGENSKQAHATPYYRQT